jgi:cold shock CspA family protein
MDDQATVIEWNSADSLGAARTDNDERDVWIHYTMLRGELHSEDMHAGLRVHLTYEPTPDQDGYTWIGVAVTAIPR